MIVLIEGVDGSGKTVLCNTLKNEGYEQISVKEDESEAYEYFKLSRNTDRIYISDRSFLSDLVYRIYDGKPRRGMNLYSILHCMANGIKVVFCHTDSSYEDSIKRGEDNITSRNANSAINVIYHMLYRTLKIFTDIPVIDYNWKTDNVSDIIKFIERR